MTLRDTFTICLAVGTTYCLIRLYDWYCDPKGTAHTKCNQKIQTERKGRINAEKQLRRGVVEKISDPNVGYPLLVIGTISSAFKGRRGTPRQGLLVPNSRATITLSKEIPKETLDGLQTYSHMFVQFLFHENTNLVKTVLSNADSSSKALHSRTFASKSSTFSNRVQNFAARVLPPLLGGDALGLFATRSPHRPNAIGLSLVKIVSVDLETRTVVVSGADLVDQSPIVDLKPWGPFDCPTCIHNVVDHDGIVSCNQNGPRCDLFRSRVPDWVLYGLQKPYKLPIEWQPQALDMLQKCVQNGQSQFYKQDETQELKDAIEQMLGLDIRSVHRGRGGNPIAGKATDLIGDSIQDNSIQNYEADYDVFNLKFTVRKNDQQPWIMVESLSVK